VVPAAPQVDLGSGVAFTLPDGFTQQAVNNGIEITDGTLRFFAQVATRAPGDDPLQFAQEYIDSFESTFDAASFSQAIPAAVDTTGVAPSDGYFVYYRVMNADGSGFRGLIDATRRADGLVYLTDTYRAIDDDSGAVLPDSVYDEFYDAYLGAPLVGDTVDLPPLTLTRLTSTHPTFLLDGVVALSPPPGWTVELPGPGRVALARPDGQRFAAVRLADTADPLVAQDLAFEALQVALPGATIAGFTPSREGESVISFDTAITAADAPSGRAVEGVVRVWIDTVRAQVFAALSSNFTDTPPALGEEDFLISALDLSLVDDH
jgi:catechol 2,3-dioxygenase-like lactoylglutathione lyase family enzyme